MPFDVSGALKKSQTVKDGLKSSNSEDYKYKVFYPYKEGKLSVRLLYNPASDVVHHHFSKHFRGDKKEKIMCLETWGKPCLIDPVVHDIKQKTSGVDLWKNKSVFRGVSFAQFISTDYSLNEDDEINPGDIILLMYPKTILNDITGILDRAGQDAEKIVAQNNGFVIEIDHQTEMKGGRKTHVYSAVLKNSQSGIDAGFEKHKVIDLGEGKEDEEEKQFEELLKGLEPLTEQLGCSLEIPEGAVEAEEEFRDSLKSQFLNVSDPNKKPEASSLSDPPQKEGEISEEDVPFNSSDGSDDIGPDCFGQFDFSMGKYDEMGCLDCLKEIDCKKKTKAISNKKG